MTLYFVIRAKENNKIVLARETNYSKAIQTISRQSINLNEIVYVKLIKNGLKRKVNRGGY